VSRVERSQNVILKVLLVAGGFDEMC
jgi:hypothetical protein